MELLDTTAAVEDLAAALVARKALPASQPRDAFPIAIAAVNGVRYLATWNFKHIANPTLQTAAEAASRRAGRG